MSPHVLLFILDLILGFLDGSPWGYLKCSSQIPLLTEFELLVVLLFIKKNLWAMLNGTVLDFCYHRFKDKTILPSCLVIDINAFTYVLVSRAIFSSCKLNIFCTWKQRTTSVHYPQGNRLVERQKKTFIIDALVNFSDENPTEWPYLINRVFFSNQAKRLYKKICQQFFYYITTTQLYQSILLNIEYIIITNSNYL